MKKILIVATDMEIGGAERALLGLLNTIDTNNYKVDLFLLRHEGPFMNLIPKGINLLPEMNYYSDLGIPLINVLKKRHFKMFCQRLLGKYKAKRFIRKNGINSPNSVEIHYSYKYTLDSLPMINEREYDLALSFTIPYYILDKRVISKNKAVWIHTDYTKLDGDRVEELKVWDAYPNIISISEDVRNTFITVYPSLANKIITIENIINEKSILDQANMFDGSKEIVPMKNGYNILSIGRFTDAKNFDNIPEICSQIIERGINVKWYIIGYGKDEGLIRKKINDFSMQNHVIILGKKDNPYPYINCCDIYIQPSRYEGKAVSVREAQILCKPVIITDFPTSSSQLEDKFDGMIVPMENDKCSEAIVKILENISILEELKENCKHTNYSNEEEITKIYNLLK